MTAVGDIIHVVVDAVKDRLGNVEHAIAPAIVTAVDEETGKVAATVFPNSSADFTWHSGISIHDRIEDAIEAFVNPEHAGVSQEAQHAVVPAADVAPEPVIEPAPDPVVTPPTVAADAPEASVVSSPVDVPTDSSPVQPADLPVAEPIAPGNVPPASGDLQAY